MKLGLPPPEAQRTASKTSLWGRSSRRRTWAASIAAVLIIAGAAAYSAKRGAASSFERRFPGFEEQNRRLIEVWSKQPKATHRDQIIETARKNLQWANEYKRTGIDPEFGDQIAIEQELTRQDAARAKGEANTPAAP